MTRALRLNRWLAALVLSACALVSAETVRVVGVSDGDTLTVVGAQGRFKVRLAAMDAPERQQPYANAAKEHLAKLVHHKTVSIDGERRDRYGRVVSKVLRGRDDIGLAMVRAGFAWHDPAYAHEQTNADVRNYSRAHADARKQRRGLWAQRNPTPPWKFRAQERLHTFAPHHLNAERAARF